VLLPNANVSGLAKHLKIAQHRAALAALRKEGKIQSMISSLDKRKANLGLLFAAKMVTVSVEARDLSEEQLRATARIEQQNSHMSGFHTVRHAELMTAHTDVQAQIAACIARFDRIDQIEEKLDLVQVDLRKLSEEQAKVIYLMKQLVTANDWNAEGDATVWIRMPIRVFDSYSGLLTGVSQARLRSGKAC
jgi:hypothetical protein